MSVEAIMEAAVRRAGFEVQAPETEIARLVEMNTIALKRHRGRIADTRAALKEQLDEIAAEEAAEKTRHAAELARLAAAAGAARDKAARDIAADKRIVASVRAALEELEAE